MLAAALLAFSCLLSLSTAYPETRLWFNTSGSAFTDTILIGNGRLGGSIWGNVTNDRVALNEETLWAGGPYNNVNPNAAAAIPTARRLLNEGKWLEAQDFLHANAMAIPERMTQYQTAGSLLINVTDPVAAASFSNYQRDLDLKTAVSTTSYTLNGVNYTRTFFVSAPAKVLVVKLSATSSASQNFTISLDTPTPIVDLTASGGTITLNAKNTEAQNGLPGVMTYQDRLKLYATGGQVTAVPASAGAVAHLKVEQADEIVLVIGIATSFVRYDDGSSGNPARRLDTIFASLPATKVFDTLLSAHIASHSKYFDRFTIDTGNVAEFSSLPTNARIQRGKSGGDPGIISLYVNFARYLLISSSQPGSVQPANLQGIWQHDLNSAWQSKFTNNINVEQNYWPAQVTGLSETLEPLIRLIEDVATTGANTAQVMYKVSKTAATPNGRPPWVVHHNTDQWRQTAPVDSAFYGFWPTGGAWLLTTIYEHYLFNPSDMAFAKRVYPLFQGASEFFLQTLQQHPNNTEWLVTNPSLSPEKAHHDSVSLTIGPTMDLSLLRDLFNATATLAKALKVDADFANKVNAAAKKLPPFMITSAGALQEWIEDYEPQPPAFSHISPMYPLYPSAQIDPRLNKTTADAAKTYLTYRGDGTFGWPVAWRIGTWARLLDGEHVYTEIKLLTSGCCAWPSLQGRNSVFQIDANLGGGGAMVEMFVQSHNGEIHLLPAMPSILATGSVRGIRARGGFTVDVSWENGVFKEANLTASMTAATGVVRLTSSVKTVRVTLAKGESKRLAAIDFV